MDAPFDLMIVSPGGHPKDINIYQAQKGMAQAAAVTKDGGSDDPLRRLPRRQRQQRL